MRRVRVVSSVLAAFAVTVATAAGVPTPATLTSCMKAAGWTFQPGGVGMYRFPEEKQTLSARIGRTPVTVYYTTDDSSAIRLFGRFINLAQSFGFTKAQETRIQGRVGRIVWVGDLDYPMTRAQIGSVQRCLTR